MYSYLHQFDQLVFQQEVLHRMYEQEGSKYHQLILPIEFRALVSGLLPDEQCHALSTFSVAVIMPNQQAKTLAKAW